MVPKMRYLILSFTFLSFLGFADDHNSDMSFPGLVSSEAFDLGNGMVMHVEEEILVTKMERQSIFILLQEHLFTFLMEHLNQSLLVTGKSIIKMNIGSRDLIGFMVVNRIHHHCQKVLASSYWLSE